MTELQQLLHLTKQVHETVKDIHESGLFDCKPEVEEGQYWEIQEDGFLFPKNEIIRIKSTTETCAAYDSINSEPFGNSSQGRLLQIGRPLSDSKIQQALIEEAERRGFEKGKMIKSARSGEDLFWNGEGNIHYNQASDELIASGAYEGFAIVLYRKGNWAEIIEDEWEAKYDQDFNDHVVAKGDNRIINTSNKITEQEAEAIAKALNSLTE